MLTCNQLYALEKKYGVPISIAHSLTLVREIDIERFFGESSNDGNVETATEEALCFLNYVFKKFRYVKTLTRKCLLRIETDAFIYVQEAGEKTGKYLYGCLSVGFANTMQHNILSKAIMYPGEKHFDLTKARMTFNSCYTDAVFDFHNSYEIDAINAYSKFLNSGKRNFVDLLICFCFTMCSHNVVVYSVKIHETQTDYFIESYNEILKKLEEQRVVGVPFLLGFGGTNMWILFTPCTAYPVEIDDSQRLSNYNEYKPQTLYQVDASFIERSTEGIGLGKIKLVILAEYIIVPQVCSVIE